jgi:hypothetical protein
MRSLCDPQQKQQLAPWKLPRNKKPLQDISKGKVMLKLFFGSSGIHPRWSDCKQAQLQ